MRVAVVGQGPRGIQALFALAENLRSRRGAQPSLDVVCFDPQPAGYGAAYAVDQPDCLRLNVRPDIVDLPGCPSLVEWLSARGLPASDTPRSQVGAYLDEMRSALLADLPAGMRVTTHRASVSALHRVEGGWRVEVRAGIGVEEPFDEVLLCLGHAEPTRADRMRGPGDADGDAPHDAEPLIIGPVYPTSASLTLANVPPDCRVVVRGAALTFIDVALVLGTERDERQRPRVVIPTSRSGLLMNTKPLARCDAAVEEALAAEAALLIGPGPCGVLTAPRALAAALLRHLHDGGAQDGVVHDRVLDGGVIHDGLGEKIDDAIGRVLDDQDGDAGRPAAHGRAVSARERLAASVALAELVSGTSGPSGAAAASGRTDAAAGGSFAADVPFECEVEWALGRAWALLYPRIVEAVSWFDGATPSEWAQFQRRSARYERLTFGPTLPQAKRLLALCDAGFVDTSWLDVRRTLDAEPRSRWGEFADVVIDAVLAPPGVAGNERPLVDALLADGHATRAHDGRRGLLVDDAARCLDAQGRPTPGLSAVGRISEDVVVGHDTLNRHAHPHLARWARRIGESL